MDMLAAFPEAHGRNRAVVAGVIVALLGAGAVAAGLAGAGLLFPRASFLAISPDDPVLSAADQAQLDAFLAGIDGRIGKPAASPIDETPLLSGEEPPVLQLRQATPEEAFRANAANPIAKAPNPPAPPFFLAERDPVARERSVDCLTAAIHYEAAGEGVYGQRAVAQVVLNRLRHPNYPKTVCGVVFEGSARTTGCQFTFTCDGSLGRKPNPAAWSRARAVAEAALNGAVSPGVGLATHYHTVWVVPYWSPTLVKVARIGAHIFYRWQGLSTLGSGPGTAFAPPPETPSPVIEAAPAPPVSASAPPLQSLPEAPQPVQSSAAPQTAPAATPAPEKKPVERPSRDRVRSIATPDGW